MTLEEITKLKERDEYIGLKIGYSETLHREITEQDLDSTLADRKAYVAELAAKQAEESLRRNLALKISELAQDQLTALSHSIASAAPPEAPPAMIQRAWNWMLEKVGKAPPSADKVGIRMKTSAVLEKWSGEKRGEPDERIFIEEGKVVKVVRKEKR